MENVPITRRCYFILIRIRIEEKKKVISSLEYGFNIISPKIIEVLSSYTVAYG